MKIVHFEKLSLVDYPDKLASTVFTLGCNFRCGFCHSPELVDPTREDFAASLSDRTEKCLEFLRRRRGRLEGVCVTGGEPTLWDDLPDFLRKVKELGLAVKLDTNGSFPRKIERLLAEDLVDYWAMDIKHAPEKYHLACGRKISPGILRRSVRLLIERAREYEFRTTAVPGLHRPEDFVAMADFIAPAERYFIQSFRAVKTLRPWEKGRGLDLELCAAAARARLPAVAIRNYD